MDADSLDDVVGADPVYDVLGKRGAVYRWTQENGQWLRYVIDADFYGATFVDTADLDQDGDLDVIVSAYYGESYQLPPQAQGRNGRYAWIENLDGMGGSWQTHIIGELFWGAESLQAGDIDGDGDLDLVGTSSLTDGPYVQQSDLTWFENTDGNGMTWQQHDIDSSYEPYSTLALLRDMDQDGDLDLVTTRREQLDIRWNDQGDGSQWTRKAILVCIGCVPYADIADVDGDGEIDLLASSFSYTGNSQALWFQNLGKGLGWQQYTVQTGLGNWKPGLPAAT